MIYHTGFYFDHGTVVFQFSECIDCLSCELIEYTGKRETTIEDAQKRLDETKTEILSELQKKYSRHNLKSVIIETE